MTPEATSIINSLRAKMARGEEPTDDEMIQAVRLLREDRKSAAIAGAAKGAKRASTTAAKAAVANINGDDLLNDLLG